MSLLLTTCYGHGISQELEGWFQGIAHNVTVSSARYYLSYLIHEVAELWDSGILGVFCISPAQRQSFYTKKLEENNFLLHKIHCI